MSNRMMRLMPTYVILLALNATMMAQSPGQRVRRSIGKELDVWVTKTEELLVPAADAMPEDKYGFAPTAGKFEGVRSFAEQVKHLAATNYMLASAVLGVKPPHQEHDESAPDSLKSKAEIMEYLKGSFVKLHKALLLSTPDNLTEMVRHPFGSGQASRLGITIIALAHINDHYGQMVEYLRMNGIVPPASR